MKTIKLHKIEVSKMKAETMVAFKMKDSVYKEGNFFFNINYVSKKGFRLIHDGVKLIAIIEGTEQSITMTIFEVEEFVTKKEALDKVSNLGLEIEDKF